MTKEQIDALIDFVKAQAEYEACDHDNQDEAMFMKRYAEGQEIRLRRVLGEGHAHD